MTTRPYSELIELVEAFAGASLGTQERNRIKALANRRAKKAYRATNYWPRFLKVGEEREVTSEGLLAFEQTGLDTIDTVLRIHASRPFYQQWAREYEFFVQNGGAQIINYVAKEHSENGGILILGDAAVSNEENDDLEYINYKSMAGFLRRAPNQVNDRDVFSTDGSNEPFGLPNLALRVEYDLTYGWQIDCYINGTNYGAFWQEGTASGLTSPVGAVFITNATGNSGTFTIEEGPLYAAFVSYKAAHSTTYGDGATDESEVPEEWFDYMAYGAYADWLRGEGQTEKAIVEDAAAKDVLDDQLEKISDQHIASQVAQRIFTHANAQTRY